MIKKKVLIATGGTGGHVFPAYSLAKYLTNKNFHVQLTIDKRGAKYFTFKEVLDGCIRHNFIALNASIAFFTLFAMVPLILLIFFILSLFFVYI